MSSSLMSQSVLSIGDHIPTKQGLRRRVIDPFSLNVCASETIFQQNKD